MAELDFNQQVGNASVPRQKPPRAAPVFGQLIFPFLVSLRISMAWRWWAEGSLSQQLQQKTSQCLKGARKVPLKTQ